MSNILNDVQIMKPIAQVTEELTLVPTSSPSCLIRRTRLSQSVSVYRKKMMLCSEWLSTCGRYTHGTKREGSTLKIPSAPITQPAKREVAYSLPGTLPLQMGLLCEATWAIWGAVYVSRTASNLLFRVFMARLRRQYRFLSLCVPPGPIPPDIPG